MDNSEIRKLVTQNVKRVIQLEPQIHYLINSLDLGVSGLYDTDDILEITTVLSDTLGQMDSDLLSISNLLSID